MQRHANAKVFVQLQRHADAPGDEKDTAPTKGGINWCIALACCAFGCSKWRVLGHPFIWPSVDAKKKKASQFVALNFAKTILSVTPQGIAIAAVIQAEQSYMQLAFVFYA